RGRGRRAASLDAALPPGRGRARRRGPAKPRRRQSLLARPLHRTPRQRRPPAAHHRDQGGDRRGEPARRPRIAPVVTPAGTGGVSPRDPLELRLLGRLLSQANLMDQASALSAPENAAFQQGLAAVATDDRGLMTVLDAIQRLTSSMRGAFSAEMITAAGPVMVEV